MQSLLDRTRNIASQDIQNQNHHRLESEVPSQMDHSSLVTFLLSILGHCVTNQNLEWQIHQESTHQCQPPRVRWEHLLSAHPDVTLLHQYLPARQQALFYHPDLPLFHPIDHLLEAMAREFLIEAHFQRAYSFFLFKSLQLQFTFFLFVLRSPHRECTVHHCQH
jgi:hypothetical protein